MTDCGVCYLFSPNGMNSMQSHSAEQMSQSTIIMNEPLGEFLHGDIHLDRGLIQPVAESCLDHV